MGWLGAIFFTDIPLSILPWCHDQVSVSVKAHSTIGSTYIVCKKLFSTRPLLSDPLSSFPNTGQPIPKTWTVWPWFRDLIQETFKACKFISSSHWPTLKQWMTDNHLSYLGFWQLSQLSNFLWLMPPASIFSRPFIQFEKEYEQQGLLWHTVSIMYNLLNTPPEDSKRAYLSGNWNFSWPLYKGIQFSTMQTNFTMHKILGMR